MAQIELQDGNFTASIKKVNDSMNGVSKTSNSALKNASSNMKGVFTALMGAKAVTATMGLVKDSIGSAMDRMDTMDQFERTMTVMLGSSKAANAALEKTSGIVKGTAYGMNTAAKSVQGFVTSGLDINKATSSVESWGNAVAFYGDGTDATFGRVTDALSKMSTKGKVNLENLNTAIEAGIPVIDIYAKKTGKSTEEVAKAISSGSVDAKDFMETMNEAFNEGVEGFPKIANAAKDAGASWRGSMDNMKAAVTRGMVGIIQSVDEGLEKVNLPSMREGLALFGQFMEKAMASIGTAIGATFEFVGDVLSKFEPQIKAVAEWFTETWTNIQTNALPIVTEIFSVISGVFSSLMEFVTNLFTGENSIANSFMTAFSTIAEVAIPILQDAFQFIGELFDTLVQWWKENGAEIAESVKTIFSGISENITTVMNFLAPFIEGSWANIKTVIKTALDIILGIVKVVTGLLSGNWEMVMEGLKEIAGTIWGAITELIGNAVTTMKNVVNNIWDGIKNSLSKTWGNIKQTASDKWEGIKSAIVKPIEKARDKVKEVLDKIKGFFSNLKLKFPDIQAPKLPHFSLKGKFSLKEMTVPRLNVDWYATGGIATGPSVVGIGENGSEAILPLSNKARMKPFAQTVGGIINKDAKGIDSGRSYPETANLEVNLNVGSRKMATVLLDDILELAAKRQDDEFREVGDV